MKNRPVESRPMFVVGILLDDVDGEEGICWKCMTETEYLHEENITLYSNTEFGYPIWCYRCGSPIEIPLSSWGIVTLKKLLVECPTCDISPWVYQLESVRDI